jgi:flagellar hook-associated protein 1 FlgK
VSKTLNPAQNRLGQIAVGLAETFNNQHALGQDMNGNVGKAFFNLGAIPVNANTQNAPGTSDSLISVSYDSANVSKLTTSDYKVTYDGSAFQVVRASDNQTLGSLNTGSTSLTVDGLTFNYNSSLSSASAGDSFLVQPTRYAASKLSVALTDPSQIASAAATKTMADTANVGKGQISTGTMYNSANLASLFPASPAKTTMTFDGANLNFSGLPSTAAIQVTHSDGTVSQYAAGTTTVPFIPGESIALGTSFAASSPAPTGDYSFKISGSMAVNDKFYLSRNTGASADNSNALALGNLQTTSVLNGGKETYQGAYSQLVGVVGNTAKDVSVNLSAQESLVTQLETNQQSISGVNLDEVAANLIRYQQAYQAAGKLIQVSSTLFNQILNM